LGGACHPSGMWADCWRKVTEHPLGMWADCWREVTEHPLDLWADCWRNVTERSETSMAALTIL
jgi:hypothetical protein